MLIRNSLKGRFIIVVFTVCFCCLLVVSMVSYYNSYILVREETNQVAYEAVSRYASELNNWFMQQAGVLHAMSQDIEINRGFSDEYLSHYLSEKFQRRDSCVIDYYIGFPDSNRKMVCATGWVPPEDYEASKRDWYKEAVKRNNLVYITPYLDADTKEMIITLAEPIRDGDKLLGVLAADILLTDVMKLAQDVHIDKKHYNFLLDDHYNFIVHPHPDFQPLASESRNASQVMQGLYLPLTEQIQEGRYPIIELKDYDNSKRCFALSEIKETGWIFGIAIPHSEYFGPLKKLWYGFALALAISLFIGFIIILPVVRNLLRPIEDLHQAVGRFADKDFSARSLVTSADEVGELSNNFNRMADIIQEYNVGLERKVEEKTAAIRNLLDNAGQGFLSFGSDLQINQEYSSECKRVFGFDIAGQYFPRVIFPGDEAEKQFLENALQTIFGEEDEYRRGVYLSLLPEELMINGRHIQLEYKVIANRNLRDNFSIMLIITDITEKRCLEKQMEEERELLEMVVKVVANRDDFLEYRNDFQRFCVQRIGELLNSDLPRDEAIAEIYRQIHTFKGGFAQMKMSHLFNQLHDCESEIAASRDELRDISAVEIKDFLNSFKLLEAMAGDISLLEEVLGEEFLEHENKLLIDEQRLLEIKQKMITCLAPWECKMLLPYIKRLRFRPFKELLRSYPENVSSLAESLGKSLLPLRITGGDMLVDSDYYHDFCKSLLHVFRNAIDHGLESPEDRLELGKNEYGIISCDIKEENGGIAVVISDDGRGIDIDLLKEQALDRGIYDEEYIEGLSCEEALQLIFADSLSSKEEVSSISGRGMGMPAVKVELDKLGGKVEISSKKERGTRFCFWLPAHDKIDVENFSIEEIINPLLETAREFFSREIGINLLHSTEVERKKRQELLRITAFITIKGVVRSYFILSVDEELGRYLVQAMTMDEIESGTEEDFVEDVLAECANMILGNSIKLFPGISELVMLEVPVTLYSDQTAIKHLQADIWTCDFLFEEGRLRLGLISQEEIYSCL